MKEIHINSHLLSRNLEAKLSDNQFLVFNLVAKNGRKLFEIVDSNNPQVTSFCKKHGKRFDIKVHKTIEIGKDLVIVFN